MAVQGLTFGVAAILSLFILRPIALKHLKKTAPNFATNVDALVGAPALALTEVNEISGQVKLSGETWSARTQSGVVATGSKVEVLSIEGATAVIKLRG
jgi:membrane protein implicated in regulation of membrane protease activity